MIEIDKVLGNLINLAENKYELLNEIYLLTEKQAEVIDEADIKSLTLLIDEKQSRLDMIRKLDIQFEAITDDIKTLYEVRSLDELEIQNDNLVVLKNSICRIMGLLENIVELESCNKDKINESKKSLEEKMENTNTGKKAIKQYGGMASYTDSFFFDKKIK